MVNRSILNFILMIIAVSFIAFISTTVMAYMKIKPGDVEKFGNYKMVFIPGGKFVMGADIKECPDCFGEYTPYDEQPHRVSVSSFWMGRYEVTVAEYLEFSRDNRINRAVWQVPSDPYYIKSGWDKTYRKLASFKKDDRRPIVGINWYDAVMFCNWMSKKHGLKPYYLIRSNIRDKNNLNNLDMMKWTVKPVKSSPGFRLPTEAEWEYANSGGSGKKFYWGDETTKAFLYENFCDKNCAMHELANKNQDDGFNLTSPVGSYKPNPFGIYDMSGNVAEWCWDWYYRDYYKEKINSDPPGPWRGELRVARGGAYSDTISSLRPASRGHYSPSGSGPFLGFRLVRSFDKK